MPSSVLSFSLKLDPLSIGAHELLAVLMLLVVTTHVRGNNGSSRILQADMPIQ